MVKELVHDPLFLGIKSKPAVKDDILVGRDLLDTLMAHRETCVGMAARSGVQPITGINACSWNAVAWVG